MLDTTVNEVSFAIQAVRRCANLIHKIQKDTTKIALSKEDKSPVTVADYTAQALVGYLLGKYFPNVPLVAEESTSDLDSPEGGNILDQVAHYLAKVMGDVTRSDVYKWIARGHADPGDRYWTLDPLDGTKGFLRGDQFAVALALIDSQKVKIGVLGCPNLSLTLGDYTIGPGCLVIAMRGGGCWTTSIVDDDGFYPLHVSAIDRPEQARVLRSFEAAHTNVDQVGQFMSAWGVKEPPLILDSQAKYALLAAGNGEVCLRLISEKQPDYKEKIWDQAAGALIVEEAGGRISDLDGKDLDFSTGRLLNNNRGILATNGLLHASALEQLRRIGA